MSKKRKSVCSYDWNLQSAVSIIKRAIALRDRFIENINDVHVYFSPVNRKGAPMSVSTIPGANCPDCKFCLRSCYDMRHCLVKPSVMVHRAENAALLKADPDRFFSEVSSRCKSLDKMRWYVGGDIDSRRTLDGIIFVALDNPHCKFHLFTKNNRLVNSWLDEGNVIPDNLHLRLSEWPGRTTDNPHNLNLCSVYDPDDFIEVRDGEAICGSNCTQCAIHSDGCFNKNIKRVWIAKH